MKTVVIVEDIHAVIEKEGRFFDRPDIRIFTVSSNEQALAFCRAEKTDLIIAKLDSPGMRGEVLCSLIRKDKGLRRISLMLVCSGTESDFKRYLNCGANTFIAAPIDSMALLKEANKLLYIAPRKLFRVPLSIRTHGTPEEGPFIGYTENISASGMLLHSDKRLSRGNVIVCSFYLPDSKHITLKAEVVRIAEKETEHDTNCYGIKFIDPGLHFSSKIEAFVEQVYLDT